MTMDAWADLVIGYQIDLDQFKVTIPEESHMEDRYSEKTGRKLKKQGKVVDRGEYDVFRFEEIEEIDEEELAEKLGEKIGASVITIGDISFGDFVWYISAPMSATSVEGLQRSLDGVPAFKKAVEESGIEVGDFEVDVMTSSGN